jgi:hypothetical protein
MADDLRNTDHREVFRIDDDFAPGSSHALPASTKKFNLRLYGDSRPRLCRRAKLRNQSLPQSFDELSPIHFTRSLTSRDENPHAEIVLGPDETTNLSRVAQARLIESTAQIFLVRSPPVATMCAKCESINSRETCACGHDSRGDVVEC